MRDSQGEIRDREKSNMEISFMAFEIKRSSFSFVKRGCMSVHGVVRSVDMIGGGRLLYVF